ncbi:MAG TPA: shikimate dehydrogenase [Parasegetibacter sp.]
MPLFGLIGYPLSHSFSGKYFTEKFEKEGLTDHRYELYPLSSVEQLPQLLASEPELRGLNVTIPYKQQVLQFLDNTDSIPEGINACNCIKIQDGRLIGYNTDIVGFEKSFLEQLQPHHNKALVLGNGGAAAAVTYVLKKLGIAYNIVSRNLHRSSSLTYSDLNESIISKHKVIINTTPLGTFPDVDVCPPIPYEFLTGEHYLYDLIYNPSKTLFLKNGEKQSAIIKNGYEMLLLQAEESWRIWNDR